MSHIFIQKERTQLLALIENLRKDMTQLAYKEGLSSMNVIKKSQELDEYLYLFQSYYAFSV